MYLPPGQTLQEGSDLWIISDAKTSYWYGKIDWLINFQLSQYEQHKTKPLSPWIKEYLQESQIEIPNISLEKNNCLIPVKTWIPTQWICVIPYRGSIQNWIESSHLTWNQWQKPSLRVFIPKTIQTGEWKSYWKTLEPNLEPSLVIDSNAISH